MRSADEPNALRVRTAGVVSYRGEVFAPASDTYTSVSARSLDAAALVGPLAVAAIWEAAFALEAGPLSTWRN